jgi:Ca2+/Na+ antiporter
MRQTGPWSRKLLREEKLYGQFNTNIIIFLVVLCLGSEEVNKYQNEKSMRLCLLFYFYIFFSFKKNGKSKNILK